MSGDTQTELLQAIRAELEAEAFALAMWEGGAAAWGRLDDYSDIDLHLLVEDDQVVETYDRVERLLENRWGIDLRYAVPEPTWHGHSQRFYRLRGQSPFLLLDLCVMRRSNPNRYRDPARHGEARIHFDKGGFARPTPRDPADLREELRAFLPSLRDRFDLFQAFPEKELLRGQDLEALAYYQGLTLRPLVQLLRIVHAPERHDFHTRYVHHDLPEALVADLRELFFVRDARDLEAKRKRAAALFHETYREAASSLGV